MRPVGAGRTVSLAVTGRLSHFVATMRPADVPPEILHEAKRALMNFMATALAGCRDPGVMRCAEVYADGAGAATCTVIGHTRRTDARHAAALNAISGNVFDFDDTHMPTIVHPTAPVAPPLWALAQTRGLRGLDLLTAFVVGVEIECRLALAVSPEHYARGWHITSTSGVFGAGAAAAHALGLDAAQVAWAFGHASAQSSGLVETLGSMAKSVGVGNAAANGLLSARLAQAGVQGPAQPLEGPRGFLAVMGSGTGPERLELLAADLGRQWALQHNTYKPYPCGVVLNPVIEACLSLHDEAGVHLDQVARVTLRGHPLLRQRTDRCHPASGREAQVSAQHAVVASLGTGRAGLDEFSDARVRDWADRRAACGLNFVDDAGMAVDAAQVTLHLRDGRELTRSVAHACGSLAAPLSDADLERKLIELAAWGGSGVQPEPLIDAIWALDRAERAATLIERSAAASSSA